MPTLRFVVACEKVIVDQAGPVSLISIFQKMNVQIQAGVPLPEKAIAPNQWAIFCLWENVPQEVGTEFTQITRVFAPDRSLFIEHEGPFRNNDVEDSQTKVHLQFSALPIWAEGKAEVKVWLKGDEVEAGSYHFDIRHLPQGTMSGIDDNSSGST